MLNFMKFFFRVNKEDNNGGFCKPVGSKPFFGGIKFVRFRAKYKNEYICYSTILIKWNILRTKMNTFVIKNHFNQVEYIKERKTASPVH